ncbi:MAG: AAA family ATPase [Nitrososphaera sp.]
MQSPQISKLGAVDPKATAPSRPKITIFGRPGVGKTWGALDFPKVYYVDTEAGADLAHYTDKLKKSGGVYFGREQGSQDFATVIDQVKALATETHQYKTLVIDSLSKIYNLEVNKEAERLGDRDGFGASKKPAVRKNGVLIRWLDKLDMNVILVCHEKPEWSKGEQIGFAPDAHEKLEYELHLCLRITKEGESHKATVKKSRLIEFPDGARFDWSYARFVERYSREVMEAASKKIVLASQPQLAELAALLEVVRVPDGEIEKWLKKANVESLAELSGDRVEACITMLKGKLR